MSNYSNFISFVDYTDFSLFKSLFWGNNDKKEDEKKVEKNKNKKKNTIMKSSTFTKNSKYSLNEKQKKLILKLEIVIDDYLYRKKVKNLIKTLKDNYMITCTANIPNLSLNIMRTKGSKQYKLKYEPILKQYVAFIPRKIYRNKKKLKFTFVNNKKEIFIEPQYQTEYEDGSFVNVLDLQDLKEKEFKNEEDFQKFLASYIKNKKVEEIKNEKDKNEICEIKVNLNNKNKIEENNNKEKDNTESKMNNINNIKPLKENNEFNNITVKRKKYKSKSLLKNKDIPLQKINSILKERSSHKIKKERKISFGGTEFSY